MNSRGLRLRHLGLLALMGAFCCCAFGSPAGSKQSAEGIGRAAGTGEAQCGHYVLQRTCELLGVPLSLESAKQIMPPREEGHNLQMITDALKSLGLHSEGRLLSFERLTKESCPAILFLNPDHWVVLCEASQKQVRIYDGWGRPQQVAPEKFRAAWSGMTLRVWRDAGAPPLPLDGAASANTPRIQFETLFVDKGQVPVAGAVVTYDFSLRNRGAADLAIQEVKTSCACLKSAYPTEAIPPGASGHITLEFRPRPGDGAFMHTALVKSNDPVTPAIVLTAAGRTDAGVVAMPAAIQLDGLVAGERAGCTRPILLTAPGDMPLGIRQVEVGGSALRVTCRASVANVSDGRRAKQTAVLYATFAADANVRGEVAGTLRVRFQSEQTPAIEIPVTATVVGPVEASPSILSLGEVDDRSESRHVITLRSRTGEPLQVLGVDAKELGLTWSSSQLGEQEAAIEFAGLPRVSGRVIDGAVTMRVKLGTRQSAATVSLPVFGLRSE